MPARLDGSSPFHVLCQQGLLAGDDRRQDVLRAAFCLERGEGQGRAEADVRVHPLPLGVQHQADDLAELGQAAAVDRPAAQAGDRVMGPPGRDHPADDGRQHLQAGHVAEEQVDAGQPGVDLLGRAGVDGRVGVAVAGAEVEQRTAVLQVADGAAQGRDAAAGFRARGEDDVRTDVRQVVEEGDLGGDPLDIPADQLREDDEGVERPGVVRDDQQRTRGRDVFPAAGGDLHREAGQPPGAGLREALVPRHAVEGHAQGGEAGQQAAEQEPEQAPEGSGPGQADRADQFVDQGFRQGEGLVVHDESSFGRATPRSTYSPACPSRRPARRRCARAR